MKESPPRGERIDAIVGEVHKKDHKLQMKVREVHAVFCSENSVYSLNMV